MYASSVHQLTVQTLWAFSAYKKFRKISIGNFRLGRERSICHNSHSFAGPSPSLHQNTTCLGKMFCYFFASLFVAFPSNKCLLSACVVMRSLTSACSRRSRFTVVETSPVNERTFQSCSCNILHWKRAPTKTASNKQEFLPTTFNEAHSCCNKFS